MPAPIIIDTNTVPRYPLRKPRPGNGGSIYISDMLTRMPDMPKELETTEDEFIKSNRSALWNSVVSHYALLMVYDLMRSEMVLEGEDERKMDFLVATQTALVDAVCKFVKLKRVDVGQSIVPAQVDAFSGLDYLKKRIQGSVEGKDVWVSMGLELKMEWEPVTQKV